MEITDTRKMTVEDVPLTALVPSPYNPRSKYSRDVSKLKELAADIAVHGVQQAILVRPDGAGKYEIVFGTRRADASKMAGKETIPAVVREMSAEEALELAIIENLQRTDIHFMDEAAGFKKLLSGGVSVQTVAEQVGKAEIYVHQRMALNNLSPKWAEEAYKGTLLLGAALLLSRLTPGVQQKAWSEHAKYGKDQDGQYSAAGMRAFLDQNVMTALADAPFSIDSADLVVSAGPCTTCPKRTGNSPMLFADIKQADVCTDVGCYEAKVSAFVELRKNEIPGAVEIAGTGLGWEERQAFVKKKIALPRSYTGEPGWTQSSKDACEHTKEALVVAGKETGLRKFICADLKCAVHGSRRSSGGTTSRIPGVLNEERRKQVEQLWNRRTEAAIRVALHAAVRAKQDKQENEWDDLPLEVLRQVVTECCKALHPQSEGHRYFETLWPLPKGAKAKANRYGSASPWQTIDGAKDHTVLIRILIDFAIAQDVAWKFADGEKIKELAKAYGLNIAKISAPVIKEWDAKKQASYAKRTARLAAEKKRAAKLKKGKADPKMLEVTKAKLKGQAKRMAADQKEIDAEVEKIKARTIGNMCRHCGCTEARACLIEGVACSWVVKPKKVKGEIIAGVCSNPECVAKHKAA